MYIIKPFKIRVSPFYLPMQIRMMWMYFDNIKVGLDFYISLYVQVLYCHIYLLILLVYEYLWRFEYFWHWLRFFINVMNLLLIVPIIFRVFLLHFFIYRGFFYKIFLLFLYIFTDCRKKVFNFLEFKLSLKKECLIASKVWIT